MIQPAEVVEYPNYEKDGGRVTRTVGKEHIAVLSVNILGILKKLSRRWGYSIFERKNGGY